jgi:glycosyltransferase involved in cell wall biosynthesis
MGMSGEPSVLLLVGAATGGMGAHVDSLARDLPALGHRVTVFTSPSTAGRFDLGAGRGAAVVPGWPTRMRDPRHVLRALVGVRRLARRSDVVHAHGHQAGLVAVLATAGMRRRPPIVISWHNAVLGGGPGRRGLALAERVQARRASLLTGASQDLVDRARELGVDGAELADVAAPSRATPATPAKPGTLVTPATPVTPTVLTVSRIAPQKRLDVLVDAATLLSRRLPGVSWLVAGDGDPHLLATLERRRDERNAPVTFLGARDDVPALLAAADVFALPSAWEARALVVQEAMAAGVPIVATAVGGLPDLLGGSGVLVPAGDAAALADAVAGLLTDPESARALAIAARERFAAFPTEQEVVTGWSRRYARLTRPEQRPARWPHPGTRS